MNSKTKDLVMMAFYMALAVALEYVNNLIPLQMPYGGELELHLIAIFACSYHLGWKKGGIVAILVFIMDVILGLASWLYAPGQILLDYILPIFVCGIASVYPKVGKTNLYSGIVIAMLLKYASHVLVGVWYWFPEGTYAWSMDAWIYSIGYNATYCLPTLIVALILTPILIKKLSKSRKGEFIGIK